MTEVLEAGARQPLAQAVEPEVDAFLGEQAGLKLPDKRARLVRHGHGSARAVPLRSEAVIDEAQHVLTTPAGEKATFAVKSARDTMIAGAGATPFGNMGLGIVTTGSNRDKLSGSGAKRSSALT